MVGKKRWEKVRVFYPFSSSTYLKKGRKGVVYSSYPPVTCYFIWLSIDLVTDFMTTRFLRPTLVNLSNVLLLL